MLCPSCNNFRPANDAPCPVCHVPSPLASNTQGDKQAAFAQNAWGRSGVSGNEWNNASGQSSFSSSFWQDPSGAAGPQQPFPPAPQTGDLWMQLMSPSTDQQGAQPAGGSLLPVPYQEKTDPKSLMVMPGGFPTINTDARGANPLLPALPDAEDAPVYVAPMYTKPRPLIPRYRAVSGLISVIIVFALLCTGAGYYAQSTGKLAFFQKWFNVYTPPKISSAQNMLPVPSTQATYGPAQNIIPSAEIGAAVDRKSNQIPILVNQFTVGQTIYISCSPNTTQAGMILVKLYTNNNLFTTLKPLSVQANSQITALFTDAYSRPAEGKAEIYWADPKGKNAQLAVTLLFVVEPVA